jgi:hypothetical protein
MTAATFKEWFHDCFILEVRKQNLPERALLLVDNASSHCSEQVFVRFLLPNTTALIQPMDQNSIRLTKLFYKKSLLAEILTSNENDLVKCLKNIILKTAVCLLHNAWEKVPSKTLEKCWKKIFKFNNGNDVEDNDDLEDLIPLNILRNIIRSSAEEIDLLVEMFLDVGKVKVNVDEVID